MSVLVLGSRGMLGSAFLEVLASEVPTKEVVALDLAELDITNPEEVQRKLLELHPDLIINCAAYTDVDGAETNEALANQVNGQAVGHLAAAAKGLGATIVHFSTDYVFDGQSPDGYTENAGLKPLNAYGRSKALGERLLQEKTDRSYLIRTSWLYGPNGKNFVQTILKLGREKPELKVVNDQHGKPTFTRDLVRFVLKLLADKVPYGIYHGVNEPATTWFDFTREIFRLADIRTPVSPCTSAEFPRPAKRPIFSQLKNTKRLLLRPWQQALYDYLQEIGQLKSGV